MMTDVNPMTIISSTMKPGLDRFAHSFYSFFSSFLLASFLFSCQTFPEITKKRPSRMSWSLNWVHAPSSESYTGPRYLNRNTPVSLKTETQDLLIVGNPHYGVEALDRATGLSRWSYKIRNGTEVPIALEGQYVFVAGNDGFIYALDGEIGQLLWSFPTRSENLTEIIVHKGLIFAVSSQNTLFVIDALTGKRVWIYTRPDASLFSIRGGGRPIIVDKTLFVGFGDGALVAFDFLTGQIQWELELSVNKKFTDLDSDILLYEDSLIVGAFDQGVYRIDLKTGTFLWKSEHSMFGRFALGLGYLCYSTPLQELLCLNPKDGQLKLKIPLQKGSHATSPVFFKDFIVFGESTGALRLWDLHREQELLRFEPGRGLSGAPLAFVADNHLYFVSNESYVYAMEILWDFVSF
jgi:outer membrane protein assembly factor BamB